MIVPLAIKQGAAFGYTKVLGYHPILATRADTGEIIHARMRKGSANTQRGARRFIDELIARIRRAGVDSRIVMRMDSGFWAKDTVTTLKRLDVRFTMAIRYGFKPVAAARSRRQGPAMARKLLTRTAGESEAAMQAPTSEPAARFRTRTHPFSRRYGRSLG